MDAGILWVPPWRVQWGFCKSQALIWSVYDVWDRMMVEVAVFWMQEQAMMGSLPLMRKQSEIHRIRTV